MLTTLTKSQVWNFQLVTDEVCVTTNSPSVASKLAENSIHLSDVVRVLRKYGIYLVALMVLGGTLAAIWAKFQAPQYDAVALVHLDQHSSISLGSSGGESDEYGLKMQTQIIGFTSPSIAEQTIRKIDPNKHPYFGAPGHRNLDNPQERDQMVSQFLASLSVTQVPKSELLSIRFRSQSPALAAEVVNTLVDVYFDENFAQRYKSTEAITKYLTLKMDDLKQKIQTEQNDLLNSEAKLGILSQGTTAESSLLVNEMTGLLSERVKVQSDRYLAEAEYQDMLNHPDAAIPSDIPGAAGLSAMQAQLSTAQAQADSLADRYGPNYIPLKQARAQVDSLKTSADDLRRNLLKSAAENLERVQKAEQSITDRLDSLQKEAEGRTPDTVKHEILKSQYLSDQRIFTTCC